MTIAGALERTNPKQTYVRRKSWASIFLSHCNGAIYVHSGTSDILGREWRPTTTDLMAKDWVCGLTSPTPEKHGGGE